jgi:hypothetical protein
MKRITFRADAVLVDAAKRRAEAEGTTLVQAFRHWLGACARIQPAVAPEAGVLADLKGQLEVGRHLGRDERNER